jgi:hypothetical protein
MLLTGPTLTTFLTAHRLINITLIKLRIWTKEGIIAVVVFGGHKFTAKVELGSKIYIPVEVKLGSKIKIVPKSNLAEISAAKSVFIASPI